MDEAIKVERLTVSFGENCAVNDLSVCFHNSQVTGIIGESGSGKSLLGMSILGLISSEADIRGSIIFKNKDLIKADSKSMRSLRGRVIGLIPQNPADSLNKVLKIGTQVSEGIKAHSKCTRKDAEGKAERLIKSFQFNDSKRIMDSYPFQLSGGMKQRIVSAIGLSCSPEWLIADEPTKGLDAILRGQVYDLLEDISKNKIKSMIIITHDLSLAKRICQKIIVMYRGHIVEEGLAEDIISNPMHPYTRGLIDALPSRGMRAMPFSMGTDIKQGCIFADRCPKLRDNCLKEKPMIAEYENKRRVSCNYAVGG